MNYVISITGPEALGVLEDICEELELPLNVTLHGRGTAVQSMLDIIGEQSGADRCYVFRYADGSYEYSDNIYEWVRDGIEPQIANLQHSDMTDTPGWTRLLQNREEIVISDLDHPPAGLESEAAFLKRQQIRSLLVSGIWIDNKLWGFVGLDFVRSRKDFSDCDIHTVRSIVNLFLLTRERFQQLERIADSVSLQRQIVDNIAIPIVILNLDCTIVTANPSIQDLTELSPEQPRLRACSGFRSSRRSARSALRQRLAAV